MNFNSNNTQHSKRGFYYMTISSPLLDSTLSPTDRKYNTIFENLTKCVNDWIVSKNIDLLCSTIKSMKFERYERPYIILKHNVMDYIFMNAIVFEQNSNGFDSMVKILELFEEYEHINLLLGLIEYLCVKIDLDTNTEIIEKISKLLNDKIIKFNSLGEKIETNRLNTNIDNLITNQIPPNNDPHTINLFINDLMCMGKIQQATETFEHTHKYGKCNSNCNCVNVFRKINKYDKIIKFYTKFTDIDEQFHNILNLAEDIEKSKINISFEKKISWANFIENNIIKTKFIGIIMGIDNTYYNQLLVHEQNDLYQETTAKKKIMLAD